MVYPFIRVIETREMYYVKFVIGLLIVATFIKVAHKLPTTYPLFLRPKDACNCNIMNAGGSYADRLGMPSGHVTMATFVVIMIAYKTQSIATIACALLCVLLIALSRVVKRCHTVSQVIAGVIMGIIFSILTILV